uniref:HTH CENPB-type domain-containing protein n=1 Tax=Humicola insolens TaxID=85995 RepID=A0A346DKR3_HUMIN
MPGYAAASYPFIPSVAHGLPSESIGRMPPPPQPIPQAPHTTLPMLMMPHAPWPSMLTNPTTAYAPAHSAPPVAIPSITAPVKPTKLPALQTTSQPRKTLTDEDRRAMCQYAEDHPTAKQTDIGARFGVERSTVSKVLRNKDKYLNLSSDSSNSPAKRAAVNKGKGVNVEKTLLNYVQRSKNKGQPITKEMLKDKLRLFNSAAAGDPLIESTTSAWVDKFMAKYGLGTGTGGGRLLRRASETNIPDSVRSSGSPSLSASQPGSAISPASPSGHLSPSPLSANKSDEEKDGVGNFISFNMDGAYKHSASQSTTSLNTPFTDTTTPSFPGSAISPTTSFNFSPDPNAGTFMTGDRAGQGPLHGTAGFQRPRSQTFPTLDLEYMNQSQSAEPATPKYQVPSTAPSSALDSATSGPAFTFEQTVSPPQLRHSSSSSSIAGRSTTTPLTSTSPNSPTQEDARRAADTLLSFISQAAGFVDQNEYMTLMRLTEKLRIHQSQIPKTLPTGLGGLTQIPEGDSEMPNAPPVMAKAETTSA